MKSIKVFLNFILFYQDYIETWKRGYDILAIETHLCATSIVLSFMLFQSKDLSLAVFPSTPLYLHKDKGLKLDICKDIALLRHSEWFFEKNKEN